MDDQPTIPDRDLVQLRQSPQLPPSLEARVVSSLRREGLISRRQVSWVQGVAAALLLFGAGAASDRLLWPRSTTPSQSAPGRSRYLLLLGGDVTPASDGSLRAAEYGQWARSVAARGIRISGEELSDAAQVVTGTAPKAFPELAAVGGYFVLEAASDDEAAALARSSPHVKYGGSVVLRRIATTK